MSGAVINLNGEELGLRYTMSALAKVRKILNGSYQSWAVKASESDPDFVDKLLKVFMIGLDGAGNPQTKSYLEDSVDSSACDSIGFAILEAMGDDKIKRATVAARAKMDLELVKMEVEAGLRPEKDAKEGSADTAPGEDSPLA